MTSLSTTIRVSTMQRERLRSLAKRREKSMADTLDDALEALRRLDFYTRMATAEQQLRSEPAQWQEYVTERDEWLTADFASQ